MLHNIHPVWQAILGTLLTWGLTAAGAGMVIFFNGTQRKLLDASLGFAGGVMTAASYWSLLAPAIEMAEQSGMYGAKGEYAFAPVAVGFLVGALFVFGTDVVISKMGINSSNMAFALAANRSSLKEKVEDGYRLYDLSIVESDGLSTSSVIARRRGVMNTNTRDSTSNNAFESNAVASSMKDDQWKRIVLLIIAITVHNIPEGLAVGVGFGAIGSSSGATFENARNLAIGIGIQNFPEGLAVSLPLKAAGFSTFRSFWYGQLSGMVEPLFGVVGAAAVTVASPILPYALAFAAGAMIYVVVDDIIPEANTSGNGKLATWGAIAGFLVMMILDVGLG